MLSSQSAYRKLGMGPIFKEAMGRRAIEFGDTLDLSLFCLFPQWVSPIGRVSRLTIFWCLSKSERVP